MSNDNSWADTRDYLEHYIQAINSTLERLPWEQILAAVETLHHVRLRRANVFVCGNGGSAATASHLVNDLNKGANAPGVPRFRAFGLGDNIPQMTAWSNDASYDDAFVQPLRNLAQPGDLLIAISCSGRSPNVLKATRYALDLGLETLALTGSPGGELAQWAQQRVIVPNPCTEQVEDVHMVLEHALVSALRDRATRELVPSVLLSNGRGGLPASTAEDAIPRRPAVLLDRDGVINANRADYVKSWDEFELLPGALEALASLAELSLPVVVVTNQSGVNRQIIDFEVAESINRRLMDLVTAHGGRIDAVAWCPHRPDEACGCRKPQPGLLTYAADSLHIDLPRSYLIGDAVTDMEAGLAVGCKTALTLTGRGASHRFQVAARLGEACQVVDDLAAAVDWVARDLAARRQVPEPEKQ